MEVVAAYDNSARHLGGDNTSCEDATTDGDLTGERAFLVCIHPHRHRPWAIQAKQESVRTDISSVYRFGGCLESKAHILIPTLLLRRYLLSTCQTQTFCGQTSPGDPSLEMRHTTSLRILEEGLLLKCLFNLAKNFGSVEKVQKRQTPTNLFSHGDSIQRVEGVPKTGVARRSLYADNSQMGNIILSHTNTNYIADRDLPYRHFVSQVIMKKLVKTTTQTARNCP